MLCLVLALFAAGSAYGNPGGNCFNEAGAPGPCGPGFEQCAAKPFSVHVPQFHIMDKTCTENDATAPFYDPKFGIYHYFFAVHPGNRKVKRHVVSRDFIHWAYLPIPFWDGPEAYDESAVFTGSSTVVDGKPKFVYPGLCNSKSKSWPSCDSGTNLCIAVPANESDPLYVNWTKTGVIVNNTQRDPSTAWQDPETGEWRLTTYGPTVYGSVDFKTWYKSNGTSGFHKGECPSFFPLPRTSPHSRTDLTGHLRQPPAPTHVNKYSAGPDQMAWGKYTSGPIGSAGKFETQGSMIIDAGGVNGQKHYYASKDVFDPLKKRRINWGWAQAVHAGMPSSSSSLSSSDAKIGLGLGLGFGPGSAQTLAREVMWDPAIQQLVSPPVAEQAQLRGTTKIASVTEPTPVAAGQNLPLGKSNQSEIVVTFQLPPAASAASANSSTSSSTTTRFGVVVMGGADGGLHSGTYVYVDYAPPADTLGAGEVYRVSVGVQSLADDRVGGGGSLISSRAASGGDGSGGDGSGRLGPAVRVSNCSKPDHGVCLNFAKPILDIIKGTTDVAACCARCANDSRCVSWNINAEMRQCFIRAAYKSNPGEQCVSGKMRAPPPTPPTPPTPKPPPKPSGSLPLLVGETNLSVRLFVDHSFVEAYWQDGRIAMTLPFMPTNEAAIAVQAQGQQVVVESADVWPVGAIWVSPEEVLRTPRPHGSS